MNTTDKISFRLIFIFITAMTVILSSIGVVRYYNTKNSLEMHLDGEVHRIAKRLVIGLPVPLWNFEPIQLDSILSAEMDDTSVSAIILKNSNGAVVEARVREKGRVVNTKSDTPPKGKNLKVDIFYDDGGSSKRIGDVSVIMSYDSLDDALRNQIISSIIQVILVDVSILISLIFSLSTIVLRPLNRVGSALAIIASGEADLTKRLDVLKRDEIGSVANSFNNFVKRLQGIVSQVRENTTALSYVTSEIAAGNQDLSSRTEHQASVLEQTAASMEELAERVKENSENANKANRLAMDAATIATKGGEVVGNVISTMREINESSTRIADIISVIDGIAFQTNILALNAAVEAARAGEQGRGFAVVATEVRSLASRSAAAAKEIKTMILASVEKVEQGTSQVAQAEITMKELVNSITQVTTIMSEINLASIEQANSVSQIGEAINQMDTVTQQNAALVEQMAAAASSLNTQAGDLVKTISVFKV